MLWPLVSPRKLNLEILCFSECKVSAQYIFFQNFLAACESFLFIPQRLSDWRKNYPTMNQPVQVESKIWGNFVYPSFRKILRWLTRWSCELFCFFFVVFTLFKSYEKSAAMHKNYINFLSNMRQKLLLVFQHQTFRKKYSEHSLDLFKRSIKLWASNIFPFFTCKNQNCTENQSIQLFPLYFGACHCETYPQILYHFQKCCVVKAIRYENRAKLVVLNGNKRPIRYKFYNGVKPNRYNGNKAYTTDEVLKRVCANSYISLY